MRRLRPGHGAPVVAERLGGPRLWRLNRFRGPRVGARPERRMEDISVGRRKLYARVAKRVFKIAGKLESRRLPVLAPLFKRAQNDLFDLPGNLRPQV